MRTLEEFTRIEKLLAVFHQGMLQNFFTFLEVLEKNAVSLEDVTWYIEQVKENIRLRLLEKARLDERNEKVLKLQEEWKTKAKCCPLCKQPLSLEKVTAPKGNANVHGYRGVWRCLEDDCLFEEFTTEYPEAIYDKLMGR